MFSLSEFFHSVIWIVQVLITSVLGIEAGPNEEDEQEVMATESTPAAAKQVRVLTLNDNEHQDCVVYRLKKGWKLQFRLGPSLLGQNVRLITNHPRNIHEKFTRNEYRLLEWQVSGASKSDDTAMYAEINMVIAGSFHYYFTFADSQCPDHRGSGYFIVDPVLTFGPNNDPLLMDCIQCQTVITKMLGPLSGWEGQLRVSKEAGYNMIHFTPVQELGSSLSAYSLRDQLKVNSMFNTDGRQHTMSDIAALVEKMRTEWKLVSICDIVLNHTANESPWIREHPDSAYNLVNSKHLRPAYLLDSVLHQLAVEIGAGKWESSGIPKQVTKEAHLTAVKDALLGFFIPQIKIHELYSIDTAAIVSEFESKVRSLPSPSSFPAEEASLKIIQDPEFRRLKSTVDMDLALKIYNVPHYECPDKESRISKSCELLHDRLGELNAAVFKEIDQHLRDAVDNVLSSMRYERIEEGGPKIVDVSARHPLVPRYFTYCGPETAAGQPHYSCGLARYYTDSGSPVPKELNEDEFMYGDKACYMMAHNGWVMRDDPLKNFAESDSNVYLRRELIAWGDSVKLRYGKKPEDSPYLWEHMKKYAQETARTFHGIRLDNCHSTPIHVAEYLLDAARQIKPDLYVIAELFTNSDLTDNIFVNRLGINSLIREALSAWNSHEEGRLVYLYGGEPVGAFLQPMIRPLAPSVAHAIFFDQTHDNQSPIQKRSVYDILPTTALVAMACCATGSNRGYDELVPHHVHVVQESRKYASFLDSGSPDMKHTSLETGIVAAKRALNQLHFKLGESGFSQVFVDQVDENIVTVTRHCPTTHQSVILVAYTAFQQPASSVAYKYIRPLRVQGRVDEVVLQARLVHESSKSGSLVYVRPSKDFSRDPTTINGLREYRTELKENISLEECDMVKKVDSGDEATTCLEFTNFYPSSVVCFRVSLLTDARNVIVNLRTTIAQFGVQLHSTGGSDTTSLSTVTGDMTLCDLNRALYRCDEEERDECWGGGTYNINDIGRLKYCGLQGIMSLLGDIRAKNDLGHPLCGNLRDGNWMMDYISNRLLKSPGTEKFGRWIQNEFSDLKRVPRYLIPCYFDALITGVFITLLKQCWSLMDSFITDGSEFVRALALGSVQMGGYVQSAPLPPLSPKICAPPPPTRTMPSGKVVQGCTTLSAGLPHFSVGYTRNWGRDTFIALRGLFLIPGRYDEARYMILGFGGCLRHGLIPNLLDGGRGARYNCRDAVFWWLQSVQDYCTMVPQGESILKDWVSRLYPTDDSSMKAPGEVNQQLQDVIQEALQRHFQGVKFRERNAGIRIDSQMTDPGFNNEIGVNLETGFVFGGNEQNCGTWMDKMGSSEKSGNKGKPASPRDGSAVELVGLCKSAVRWLHVMNQQGKYPYNSVERKTDKGLIKWTFKEWENKIEQNFEKFFWVNTEPDPEHEPHPELINRRGMYKDSHLATQFWADFQLRPNFCVAMVVAPEMFTVRNACVALNTAEKVLLGPLGMKTLDPSDWAYVGDYDNSDDSDNARIAKGFNYHQGPEWVWPVGYFLRAKLMFAKRHGGTEELKQTSSFVKAVLSRHFTELQTSPWRGIPELTNSNGSYCRDSCRTQAWSMGCLLEVMYDMEKLAHE